MTEPMELFDGFVVHERPRRLVTFWLKAECNAGVASRNGKGPPAPRDENKLRIDYMPRFGRLDFLHRKHLAFRHHLSFTRAVPN